MLFILLFAVSTVMVSSVGSSPPPGTLADVVRPVAKLADDVVPVIRELEGAYDAHPGFRHFLWKHMASAELSLDFLQRFALYYYEHVRVFRLYLAGAMTVVPNEAFQVVLSEVLADEFGVRLHGEPDVDGHPALFRRFMSSLGLTEAEWEPVSTGKNLLEGVRHYKRVHYSMFRGGLAEEMVGAVVFGMERTTPVRHSSVLKGITAFTSRTKHKVDSQFFGEHVAVDEYHNTAIIKPLEHWFRDPVKVRRIREGALRSFDARREFLDDLAATLGVQDPAKQLPSHSFAAAPAPAHIDLGPATVAGLNMRFEWIEADDLIPHEKTEAKKVAEILDKLSGADATLPAIVVDESKVVIDGHHRLEAMKSLGHTHVPCITLRHSHDSITASNGDSAPSSLSKNDIIEAALGGLELRGPQSTRHMVSDTFGRRFPIQVLSPLVWIADAPSTSSRQHSIREL